MNNDTKLIDLSILSTSIFIIAIFFSLGISINERNKIIGKQYIKDDIILNFSFNNRIIILIALLISLYVTYNNYNNQDKDSNEKNKSKLLLTSNALTVISAIIILYVAYLNIKDNDSNINDLENPLF